MKHLKYEDVVLVPSYSTCESRADNDTSCRLGGFTFKVPVVPANMSSVINTEIARKLSHHGYFYIMHRFGMTNYDFVKMANEEDWKLISISVGADLDKEDEFFNKILSENLRVDYITIDIAHGHSIHMYRMIERIRAQFSEMYIIAGNVATTQAVLDLAAWGADCVKVGIGQGSPCTTKDKTGFTLPMFSCVKQCAGQVMADWFEIANASEKRISDEYDLDHPIPIIADGGIKCNGDIAKALSAGATMIMAGGLFASCKDSAALIGADGKKKYFGSASIHSKKIPKHLEGKLNSLDSEETTFQEKLIEIEEDLQSSISYAGGNNLSCLSNVEHKETQ
jgi:GMP reductase